MGLTPSLRAGEEAPGEEERSVDSIGAQQHALPGCLLLWLLVLLWCCCCGVVVEVVLVRLLL